MIAMTAGCAVVMFLFFRGGISKRFPKARAYLKRLPKGEMLERSLEAFREFGRNRRFWLGSHSDLHPLQPHHHSSTSWP
jgi:hypothetical protein